MTTHSEPLGGETQSLLDNPFPSAGVNTCPYPYYDAVRDQGPVYKVPGENRYLVTHRDEIIHVTRHPEIFSNRHSVFEEGYLRSARLEEVTQDRPWAIATSDAPQHTEKRGLTFDLIFKPGRLRGYEDMIAQIVDEMIDSFADRGTCEFVSEFGDVLPARVLWGVLGLPPEHRDTAIRWGEFEGFGTMFAPREKQDESKAIVDEVTAYMRAEILARAEAPRDDLLSTWIAAHTERGGGQLDVGNVVTDAVTVIFGGIGTSSHLFSNIMMLLLQNPEQLERVSDDLSLIPQTIEEALRFESPVQQTPRIALEDTELGGVQIPAGAQVLLVWAAANRGVAFDEADRFDVCRSDVRKHVAFGHGAHFCLGAPLARLEARIAYEKLLTRLTNIRPVGDPHVANRDTVQNRGPAKLHIAFETVT